MRFVGLRPGYILFRIRRIYYNAFFRRFITDNVGVVVGRTNPCPTLAPNETFRVMHVHIGIDLTCMALVITGRNKVKGTGVLTILETSIE